MLGQLRTLPVQTSPAALVLAALAVLAGCNTQRWPGPMTPTVVPLPPGEGADIQPGLEEVFVVRHADPVQLRRTGATAGFPLRFYNKKERIGAGAWVLSGAGGKAELFWPRDGISIILFEEGAAVVGERDRDEPVATLARITRARLMLTPGARVALEGGAVVHGDDDESSGPFLLQRLATGDVLRLKNQAKHTAYVEYRDGLLPVGPGQAVDLPILDAGAAPFNSPASGLRVEEGGVGLVIEGPAELVQPAGRPGGATVEASGPARIAAQGVRVRLGPGVRARFTDLGWTADSPPSGAADRPGRAPSSEEESILSEDEPEEPPADGGASAPGGQNQNSSAATGSPTAGPASANPAPGGSPGGP
ncbi:hypothetical protein [Engelhardtia mirabilis]|uniref:Uncharacterized protein n=1 Tax=Engelhardtia mirabilis TaxID=2528011 RepID=A0A518BKB1_9BACT|nr:hypothetical protein Pla133_24950 [Planctomycetes bacterium Pla133]QDV01738.1 hypothetical protein Pla86_24940 [Planctomycetes bacterium Pla86]